MKETKLSIRCTDLFIPLMMLFALDFFDLSGIILSLLLLLLFGFCEKEVKLDRMALLMLLFSAAYGLSIFYFEGVTVDAIIKYAIAPWGCYVLGFNILRLKKDASSIKISKLLFIGFFIHGVLNLIASMAQFGINFNNNYRQAYDFWQGRIISVTTAALYYSPLVFYAIGVLLTQNIRKKKIFSVIVILISAFATLLYQNRTLILAAVIVLMGGIVSILLDSSTTKKTKISFLFGTGAAIGVILVAWITDLGGIRSFLQNTTFYARLTGANGEGQDRTKIWSSFIFGDAWKYPFGGNRAVLYKNKGYVHNTWLDIFRRGGIIPFISFGLFTLLSVRTVFLYAKQSTIKSEDRHALAFSMIGIAAMFFVEPVIEANPYIFYLPLVVIGLMNGELYINRTEYLQ